MALWDKVRQELSEAGRAAQDALDEGRLRLDILRARQRADRAAQALGYAVYGARQAGGADLAADEYARLSSDVAACQAEVTRAEEQLDTILGRRRTRYGTGAAPDPSGAGATDSSGPTTSAGPTM